MVNREELIKEILNLTKGMAVEEVQAFIKTFEASKAQSTEREQ